MSLYNISNTVWGSFSAEGSVPELVCSQFAAAFTENRSQNTILQRSPRGILVLEAAFGRISHLLYLQKHKDPQLIKILRCGSRLSILLQHGQTVKLSPEHVASQSQALQVSSSFLISLCSSVRKEAMSFTSLHQSGCTWLKICRQSVHQSVLSCPLVFHCNMILALSRWIKGLFKVSSQGWCDIVIENSTTAST